MTGIFFFACFIIGCCLAFIRHPIFGLLTYVATYYLHPPSRWWGATLPSLRWSLIAGCVTLLAIFMKNNKIDVNIIKTRNKFLVGFVFFIGWLIIQSAWALNPVMHSELIWIFIKYAILIWIITSVIDNQKHLLWFCSAHVAGCTYLGWVAYTSYDGGRFEDFGGPDISEANAGALQLLSGMYIASCLILIPKIRHKISAIISLPFMANAIILTGSRSAFLSGIIGSLIFNYLTPIKMRRIVLILSILATISFLILANKEYWDRISTIKVAGQQIEGTDTGGGRLEIMNAQIKMFGEHPLGCGHRCTATLSPLYLEDRFLTGSAGNRGRSSHNTFFTLLVEQGIIGSFFYISYLIWTASKVIQLRKSSRSQEKQINFLMVGITSFLTVLIIADFFVDYLKSEVRIWFISAVIAGSAITAKP